MFFGTIIEEVRLNGRIALYCVAAIKAMMRTKYKCQYDVCHCTYLRKGDEGMTSGMENLDILGLFQKKQERPLIKELSQRNIRSLNFEK